MNKSPYTFQVVRYSHDPAAGEVLNIGVILYCPSLSFLGIRAEHKYERLSKAFAGFDGDSYRYAMARFEAEVDRLREDYSHTLLREPPSDVKEITAELWPDQDLSIKLGPVLAGVTDDPEQALTQAFDRMVASQYGRDDRSRRSDDEVWAVYKKPLLERKVVSVLAPANVSTPDFSIDFEHAFRNQRLHVLQPISFDLVRSDAVQRKAALWLGNGAALTGQQDIGRIFLLLGKPQLSSLRPAYEKAKGLLNKMPIKHEIVEEEEADAFAAEFLDFVRKH